MLAIGAIGLAVNGWGAITIGRGAGRSANLRAAGWHLAADAAGWLDPLASLAIAAAALWAAVGLVRETLRRLLAAAPRDVDLD